jgi:hypothetical protein
MNQEIETRYVRVKQFVAAKDPDGFGVLINVNQVMKIVIRDSFRLSVWMTDGKEYAVTDKLSIEAIDALSLA